LVCIWCGDLLNNAKGRLVCCNLSLNSNVFTLNVETSCTLLVQLLGVFVVLPLGKMLHQNLYDQCWMTNICLRINLYYSHHHLCLKCCPFHQLSL
jgi:hypothetical protein